MGVRKLLHPWPTFFYFSLLPEINYLPKVRWNVLGDGLCLPTFLSVLTTNTGQGHQQFHRHPVLSPWPSIKTNFTMVTMIPRGCNVYKANTAHRVTLIWLSNMHWTCGALMACWLISDWWKVAKYLYWLCYWWPTPGSHMHVKQVIINWNAP